MKVNGIHNVNGVNKYNHNQGSRTFHASGKSNQKDELTISSEAKQLLGAQTADVQSERIHELKRQVATGTYYVEANKIAEKLLPYFNH